MVHVISASDDKRKAATDNSPGLTETAIEFMKKQSTFVHKVTYWKIIKSDNFKNALLFRCTFHLCP